MTGTTPTPRRRRRTTQPAAPRNHVIAYLRVSTGEQAESGAGLAAQRTTITAEAQRRGWHIVDWYSDEGVSAKSATTRPGLTAAITAIEEGRAAVLVASKLDRLSRSIADSVNLRERAERHHWQVFTCDLLVDTTSPSGEMQANVMAVFSQYERRIIGQRTREALAEKRAQGVRLGRPSTLPRPVVERIVGLVDGGVTYTAVAAALNEEGVPTARGGARWYPATVRQVARGQDADAVRAAIAG